MDWGVNGGVGVQILALVLWALLGTLLFHIYFWCQGRPRTSKKDSRQSSPPPSAFKKKVRPGAEEDKDVAAERIK